MIMHEFIHNICINHHLVLMSVSLTNAALPAGAGHDHVSVSAVPRTAHYPNKNLVCLWWAFPSDGQGRSLQWRRNTWSHITPISLVAFLGS